MSYKNHLLFTVLFVLGLAACEEIPPFISFEEDKTVSDTTYLSPDVAEPQPKTVFIEEFSGVRCVNCPAANEATEAMVEDNPGRVHLMVLHAGSLTQPHVNSNLDLVIEEGEFLYDFLETIAVPAASFNRVRFDGTNSIALLGVGTWQPRLEAELTETTPVNLEVNTEYDAENRTLTIATNLHYTQTITGIHNLSIAITESGIIEPQSLQDSSVEEEYKHKHVLRDMITPVTGTPLNVEKVPGRVVIKAFEFTLPNGWVPENCSVIAFVHETEDGSKRVLQSAEAGVVE